MAKHGDDHDRPADRGPVVIADGGYALRDLDGDTGLTFQGDLEGRGAGKLILGFVSARVRAGFPAVRPTRQGDH